MISEDSQCGIEANGKFILISSVTAKSVYNIFISHKFSPPTSKKLLSTKFNIEDQKTWSSVYLLSASATLDTKIRMFGRVQDFKEYLISKPKTVPYEISCVTTLFTV